MFKIKLHWQILIALVLAILFGFFFPQDVQYVKWMGDLFLRGLKMIIVPLILTSIVTGVANIGDAQGLGKLGIKTILYYVTTSLFAILAGLTLVNLFQPGVGADLGFSKQVEGMDIASKGFGNILLRMVPSNIFEALASADMLAIIFFSILVGYFIMKIGKEYKDPLIKLFNGGFEVMMKITSFVIKFTPLGIFGIVSVVVAEQKDVLDVAQRLGIYMLAVLIGLFFHAFITLPLLLRII